MSKERRDQGLATVARGKIVPGGHRDDIGDAALGHPLWMPGEQIIRADTVPWQIPQGRDRFEEEPVHVLLTEMPRTSGRPLKTGRILVCFDAKGFVTYGGIFYIEEHARRIVQSIWLAPDYRSIGFGRLLAEVAKAEGMTTVEEPISSAGRDWANRYGFRIVEIKAD